eukprot:COSAG02_NODE_532_length_20668_cov_28.281832_18_plen_188_part_00
MTVGDCRLSTVFLANSASHSQSIVTGWVPHRLGYIELTDKYSTLRGPPRAAGFFRIPDLILGWFSGSGPRLWIESRPTVTVVNVNCDSIGFCLVCENQKFPIGVEYTEVNLDIGITSAVLTKWEVEAWWTVRKNTGNSHEYPVSDTQTHGNPPRRVYTSGGFLMMSSRPVSRPSDDANCEAQRASSI